MIGCFNVTFSYCYDSDSDENCLFSSNYSCVSSSCQEQLFETFRVVKINTKKYGKRFLFKIWFVFKNNIYRQSLFVGRGNRH